MEFSRIDSILNADKKSMVPPGYILVIYVECALKTTMHTLYSKDVKMVIERNKDDYMNFSNELFTTVDADAEWQQQFLNFANSALCYDPEYVHERFLGIEKDLRTFKEDLLMLIKIFYGFSDSNPGVMDYLGVNMEDWHRLSGKYLLDKSDLNDIAWTYPYLALIVLRIYSAIERPIGMNMLWNYPGFRPEMRLFGLLGLVPRYGEYGGFVKALLHHAVLQVQKGLSSKSIEKSVNEILPDIIGLARCIYHSEISEFGTRIDFFQCMNITVEMMKVWSMTFNAQYPEFWDVHIKYFEQTK